MAEHAQDWALRSCAAVAIALLAFAAGADVPGATAPGDAAPPHRVADVTAQRLAAPAPADWVAPGRDGAGTYFSPLADIHTGNVAQLGFAWDYRLGTYRGQESTPLVIDGVMYATSNFGRVYALDAASGRELWTYDPQIDGQWARYACCDAVNRGLAAFQGVLYVGALDGWLHAIDARTGRRLWKVDTLVARTPKKPYTVTGAPLLAGELVVIGNGGGDFAGARGYVSAYDRESGRLRWRFYTVPRDPAEGPQDQPHLEAAVKTWDPKHPWEAGSGGTAWDGMAYDPALDLVYIGTGNAAPYNLHLGGRRGGDELYAASIVAIHAKDGTLAWYYQTTPGDRWDFDSTEKIVLADLELGGKRRAVLMQAPKNGYYYVLDRATGELLSAKPYAFVSWARGIDPKTGRPVLDASADYDHGPALVFPSEAGAHAWQPMAFDPAHGIAFLPAIEAGNIFLETSDRRAGLVEGQFSTPAMPPELYDPKDLRSLYGKVPPLTQLERGLKTNPASRGFLRAWSVSGQRVLWETPTATSFDGGVLATAGGEHHLVADFQPVRIAQFQRRCVQPAQRLHQAKAGLLVIGQRVARHSPPLGRGNPDRLRLRDQIADGGDQPLVVDDHAAAGALRPKGAGGVSVRRNEGLKIDHGAEGAVQVERVVIRIGLQVRWDLPIFVFHAVRLPWLRRWVGGVTRPSGQVY